MGQEPNESRKSISLLSLLLPFILIGLILWSIRSLLSGNGSAATFSILAILAILAVAYPLKWITKSISKSKFGNLVNSDKLEKPIYQGKRFSLSVTHTKRPIWFTVLLYVIGWIIAIVILIIAFRAGAITL